MPFTWNTRGCDCPLCQPQLNVPAGSFFPIWPPQPNPEVNCTFAGQSQSVCPHHLHRISRGRCWQLLGVFHSVESRQMQWESGLRRPDVTGLSKTLWPSSHPAHTLQAEVHWPQGSWSRHKGVVFMCVSVCPWAFTWASVCLCVCRWKQGLGNREWESPDCNSGCYLGNPRRKMCWMSEWVGEGCTVDACEWQGCDCVHKFKHLNCINTVYVTWYTPTVRLVFLGLYTFGFLPRQQQKSWIWWNLQLQQAYFNVRMCLW